MERFAASRSDVKKPADTVLPFRAEGILARPLAHGDTPRRIVVIRFGPFGDVVATLPVLAAIRLRHPHARLEVVTSEPFAPLLRATPLVDHVWTRTLTHRRLPAALGAIRAALRIRTADVVIDLQRSRPSTLLRKLVRTRAWAAFDRYAPVHALERYVAACHAAGLSAVEPAFDFPLHAAIADRACAPLRDAGVPFAGDEPVRPLVCLNPAGGWPTKNWPVEHYIELGRALIRERDAHIVLMGTAVVRDRARAIASALPSRTADLVGRTTADEALAIVRLLSLMVSDDSALMHLAWCQGVPTIGVFGASRATWSRPYGPHSFCFGSEDLPCGACMRDTCARHDLHCLLRVTPAAVLAHATELLTPTKRIHA
jgi:ADP-heptose:LPS heptosyltransferase